MIHHLPIVAHMLTQRRKIRPARESYQSWITSLKICFRKPKAAAALARRTQIRTGVFFVFEACGVVIITWTLNFVETTFLISWFPDAFIHFLSFGWLISLWLAVEVLLSDFFASVAVRAWGEGVWSPLFTLCVYIFWAPCSAHLIVGYDWKWKCMGVGNAAMVPHPESRILDTPSRYLLFSFL